MSIPEDIVAKFSNKVDEWSKQCDGEQTYDKFNQYIRKKYSEKMCNLDKFLDLCISTYMDTMDDVELAWNHYNSELNCTTNVTFFDQYNKNIKEIIQCNKRTKYCAKCMLTCKKSKLLIKRCKCLKCVEKFALLKNIYEKKKLNVNYPNVQPPSSSSVSSSLSQNTTNNVTHNATQRVEMNERNKRAERHQSSGETLLHHLANIASVQYPNDATQNNITIESSTSYSTTSITPRPTLLQNELDMLNPTDGVASPNNDSISPSRETSSHNVMAKIEIKTEINTKSNAVEIIDVEDYSDLEVADSDLQVNDYDDDDDESSNDTHVKEPLGKRKYTEDTETLALYVVKKQKEIDDLRDELLKARSEIQELKRKLKN